MSLGLKSTWAIVYFGKSELGPMWLGLMYQQGNHHYVYIHYVYIHYVYNHYVYIHLVEIRKLSFS